MGIVDTGLMFQEVAQQTVDVRTYTRTYLVETDDQDDDAATILAEAGIPDIGDVHPNDDFAYVVTRDVSSIKQKVNPDGSAATAGGGLYNVAVHYTTVPDETEPAKNNSPYYPYTPAVFHWVPNLQDIPVEKDIDGNPIENVLGRPYLQPPLKKVPFFTFEQTVNVRPSDVAGYLAFNGKVNSDAYYFAGPGQALALVEAEGQFWQYRKPYWTLRISIMFNIETEHGWNPTLLQNDVYEYKESTGEVRPIIIENFKEAVSPYPLTSDGEAIACDKVGDSTRSTCGDDPAYVTHYIYTPVSFAPLLF